MHPYCCLWSIRRYLCKIFLPLYVLQKVICNENDNIRVIDKDKILISWRLVWRSFGEGCFHAFSKSYYQGKKKLSPQFFTFYASLMAYLVNITDQCLSSKYYFLGFNILVFINLILLCGDIEENPGPKPKPNDNLSVCTGM